MLEYSKHKEPQLRPLLATGPQLVVLDSKSVPTLYGSRQAPGVRHLSICDTLHNEADQTLLLQQDHRTQLVLLLSQPLNSLRIWLLQLQQPHAFSSIVLVLCFLDALLHFC